MISSNASLLRISVDGGGVGQDQSLVCWHDVAGRKAPETQYFGLMSARPNEVAKAKHELLSRKQRENLWHMNHQKVPTW